MQFLIKSQFYVDHILIVLLSNFILYQGSVC